MKTKIYALRGENRFVRYVGKTIRSLSTRLAAHLNGARKGEKTHKGDWIRSMLNKGLVPAITLLEETEGNGNKEEIAWIKYFRDHGIELVNGTDGGEGGSAHRGCKHSLESRLKMSRSHIGKPLSYEAKRKIGAASRRNQIGGGFFKGKKHTLEWKKETSKRQQGHPVSIKTRLAAKRTHTGKIVSLETRQKIKQARMKQTFSFATRQKLRAAAKRLWPLKKELMEKARRKSIFTK